MFLHPRCPCSRTTINELEILLSEHKGEFETRVVFVIPTDLKGEWRDTPSRRKIQGLEEVIVQEDPDGKESSLFGARTSGETFMFTPDGELRFHGGITAARGHAGDNAGRAFLSHWKHESRNLNKAFTSPVYGCALDGLCETSPEDSHAKAPSL